MKKILSVLSLIVLMFSINSYAGIGEGVSSVGTLSSFNNTNTIIITHGYTHNGNFQPIPESQWRHYVWQFAMADTVSNNRDIYMIRKGKIWKSIATKDQYQLLTTSHLEDNIETLLNNASYFTDSFVPQPNKDNLFIFDWTLESAINLDGYAEAAADVLATTLVKIGKDYPFLLQNLHLIGHSRGCVVNSEAIQRLIYWASYGMLPNGLNIDPNIHMTTLDPHPAGHWSRKWFWNNITAVLMNDDGVNSSNIGYGVSGWKSTSHKVSHINNYFQDLYRGSFVGLNYYPGLDISSTESNYDLSLSLPQNTSAHGLVHTWFHGTVSTIAVNDNFNVGPSNIERSTQWYNSALGKTEGFYYSDNRMGDLSLITSITNDLKQITDDYRYGSGKYIFNGDFSKALTSSLPGWSYQGGSSNIALPITLGLNYVMLDNSRNELIHNPIYFPANADRIWFRMKVENPSSDDVLRFYIDDNFITSFPISSYSENFELRNFSISDYLGGIHNLKIMLTNNNSFYKRVSIDDISFYPITELESIVACPVDFHIYDNQGNHTGPINDSTFVEEILGSEYYVYEDSTGDKIKTVHLRPLQGNEFYTFRIESRDTTSTFSYRIDDNSDTTQGTVSYQFNNIAIQPNTVSTCSLDVNVQIPVLLVDVDGDGNTDSTYNPAVITAVGNNESTTQSLPTQYELFNCFPNPFNPSTSISYSIPEVSNVTLKVYDILGNEIATLVNEQKSAGHYTVYFNSKNLSSGIYFYTLQTKTYTATKKMILLK